MDEESPLKRTLSSLKKTLGFKSSRSFFHDYLEKRTRLDFNYSYYMKIEGGKFTPSPQVISSVCAALEKDAADALILAYCETIFPEKSRLFQRIPLKQERLLADLNSKASIQQPIASPSRQKFLTPLQVACIGKSKAHYFSFLLLTLARAPIAPTQILDCFPEALKEEATLEIIINDLERLKLIHVENGLVRSISNDMRFPDAETATQRKLHEQIDLWNLIFYKEAGFESLTQKMLLRRVSTRYLSVIHAHSQVLLDLVRASDEIDSDHNDDVLMLNISIQKGQSSRLAFVRFL